MDRGPRTGVTESVSLSDLDFVEGVSRRARAVVRGSRTLVDGLIESVHGGIDYLKVFKVLQLKLFIQAK